MHARGTYGIRGRFATAGSPGVYKARRVDRAPTGDRCEDRKIAAAHAPGERISAGRFLEALRRPLFGGGEHDFDPPIQASVLRRVVRCNRVVFPVTGGGEKSRVHALTL